MAAIELHGVEKGYRGRPVLRGLELTVEARSFVVVLGPPACGKSVLVRLLTGLERPDAGEVRLRGRVAQALGPAERDIGYVPQSFALYPHYSVRDNIAYPLTLMRRPQAEIEPAVREVAERLKISHLLAKMPPQLSGGEKQRVALARGIVKPTDIFLLDDPLTGLDFKLREQLFDDLKQMQQDLGAAFVYMTSDPLEALALADQVAVLDGGRIVSTGPVEDVYRQPGHLRAMELLGAPPANRIAGVLRLRDGQVVCEAGLFRFPLEPVAGGPRPEDGQAVQVAIRPQDVALQESATEELLCCRAEVLLEEDLGAEVVMYLRAGSTPLVTVLSHRDRPAAAASVVLGVAPAAAVVFAADSGARLGQGRPAHG